jgi:hypothetical protein
LQPRAEPHLKVLSRTFAGSKRNPSRALLDVFFPPDVPLMPSPARSHLQRCAPPIAGQGCGAYPSITTYLAGLSSVEAVGDANQSRALPCAVTLAAHAEREQQQQQHLPGDFCCKPLSHCCPSLPTTPYSLPPGCTKANRCGLICDFHTHLPCLSSHNPPPQAQQLPPACPRPGKPSLWPALEGTRNVAAGRGAMDG